MDLDAFLKEYGSGKDQTSDVPLGEMILCV